MPTWLVFGWGVVSVMLGQLDIAMVVYAILGLTVIRMASVWVCLAGTGLDAASRLFVGSFRPRGLAIRAAAVMGFVGGALATLHGLEAFLWTAVRVLMGAFEASAGMLAFGTSTAFLFRVMSDIWAMLSADEPRR